MMENQAVNSIANSFSSGGISFSPHCSNSRNHALNIVAAGSAYCSPSTPALAESQFFGKAVLTGNGDQAKTASMLY
jgi:hypothetical protein